MNNEKEQLKEAKAKKLAKGRLNYALARRLGFSSYEAGTMAQWSEKRIRKYANNKGDNV